MAENSDLKISEALAAGDPAAHRPAATETEIQMMIQTALQENTRKSHRLWWYNLGWHAFFLAGLLIGVGYIFSAGEGAAGADARAIGLFVCMASLSGAVAIKCWYWIIHSRLRLELRLKEMEVALVEVKEMVRAFKGER